jgi:hypothetical protein
MNGRPAFRKASKNKADRRILGKMELPTNDDKGVLIEPNSHKNSLQLIWFPAQIGYPRSAYRTTAMSRSWDRLAAAVLGGRMPEGRREAG